jgi:hypothetical protein
MNSQEIQAAVYDWAISQNFSAPYGVLTGEHVNKKGSKYRAVTFGRARTLDATVEIYNRNFLILKTNRNGTEVFKNFESLMDRLKGL